jgi:hypothetical protein
MQETMYRADHGKNNPYYMVIRALSQDRSISYEALGVLQYLLSKPNDWRVQPMDLVRKGCGREKIYKILNELIAAGYIKRIQGRDELGRITGARYVINGVEIPQQTLTQEGS